MNESTTQNRERSLGSLIVEIREELKEFVSTRAQMIKVELEEALAAAKIAVPLTLVALLLIATGFWLFTLAVVALIASALAGNPYAWFLAFLIVAVAWTALGAVAAFFAYSQFRGRGGFPKRTVEVLKADKVWLQTEARSHL